MTLAIFALVLAFNHLADALRDMLDPALRIEEAQGALTRMARFYRGRLRVRGFMFA